MADFPITGAQGTQNWDLSVAADTYHVSGNATIDAAAVITITAPAAGTPNPIKWDSTFNITSSTSGKIVTASSSATRRISFQPTGASTTWSAAQLTSFISHTSTGAPSISFCDFYYIGFRDSHGTNNASVTDCRIYVGNNATTSFSLIPSGGTNTYQSLAQYGGGVGSIGFNVSPSGGTNLYDTIYCEGADTGINLAASGGTNTCSNWKVTRCNTAGINLGGNSITAFTNILVYGCRLANVTGQMAASPTFTRLIAFNEASAVASVDVTPATLRVHTFDECYFGGDCPGVANRSATATAVADVVVSNSVVASAGRFPVASDALLKLTSSTNDVAYLNPVAAAQTGIRNGTSDNDYLAGTNGAFGGISGTTAGWLVTGPTSDWNDPNFSINVDTDASGTTSASTPIQYRTLTVQRTNAIATPHLPTTITAIVVGSITNAGATITFTSGIKAKSRILLSRSAGITRVNATVVGPWKYGGFLDPDDPTDFTLPVTSHSHVLADLKSNQTYYYRIECVDPCERHFLSAESSFVTLASGGGGAFGSGLRTGGGL